MADDVQVDTVQGASPKFRTELARQLEELVPEAVADGKVDVLKLKELLDDDAGGDTERFGLFWPGKKRAMRAAQEPTTATLKPVPELSKDWDSTGNIFIEGDNLEVLKVLQKQYHGRIKMIYIDPPYNTGKDFVYPDNYREGLQNYLEFTKQVDAGNKKITSNPDTDGRYHSHWLNMMYPRLKLARNLLTDDGVIFISIDENEQSNLKKLCDEIFGEDNFISTFTVVRSEGGGLAKQVIIGHDYVLAYARNIQYFIPLGKPKDIRGKIVQKNGEDYWIETDWLRKEFGKYGTLRYEDILSLRGHEKKREIDYGLKTDKYVLIKETSGTHIVGRYRKVSDDTSKFYTILKHLSKNGVNDLDELQLKQFFDFPKPVSLLKELILGASIHQKDSLVLDFFSGSGTTAHAVMQLNAEDGGNRKHIQVQLPEPTDEKSEAHKAGYKKISDIARERIHRAGEKIKVDYADKLAARETPLDIGYRTYKLVDTNFTKWQSAHTTDIDQLQARLELMRESSSDTASELELLTEVMLKLGLELTMPTERVDIAGLSYFRVGDGHLVYMNEQTKPSLDQLRAATDTLPTKFVILEDAFHGDDQLKTNLTQLCKTHKISLWTV